MHRRVADVQGRLDDVFAFGGVQVHPHVLRSVLGRHPEVVDYQVRQTPSGVAVHVLGAGAVDVAVDVLAKELGDALTAAGVPEATAEVVQVAALERNVVTGKLRRFVPLAR